MKYTHRDLEIQDGKVEEDFDRDIILLPIIFVGGIGLAYPISWLFVFSISFLYKHMV